MKRPEYYIGIDIASAHFTAAVGQMGEKWKIVVAPEEFNNAYDSFGTFLKWLQAHQLRPENTVICMEATGVYNEVLAHFLVANKYVLAIDPPLKVKRAFKPAGHKSDPVDACQIAEYACRYFDELSIWQPQSEILEQIKTLLTTREQFSVQSTAQKNALHALKRKKIRTPLAEQAHEEAITYLAKQIKKIDQEIERLINQDPDLRHIVTLLITIPGVKLLLAAHLLIIIQSTKEPLSPKRLAAYIGICPYDNKSGSSVHHKSTSRHYGPPALRKILFLAAISLRTHREPFRLYFFRKIAEGKPKHVAINNIANKLLKIVCAVLRSDTPYIQNFQSVNPGLHN